MDDSGLTYLGIAAAVVSNQGSPFTRYCDPSFLGLALQNNVDRFKSRWRARPQSQYYYALFAIQNGYKWMISFFVEIGLDKALQCNHRLFIWALATKNHNIVNFVGERTKGFYSYKHDDIVLDIAKEIPPRFGPLRQAVYNMYGFMYKEQEKQYVHQQYYRQHHQHPIVRGRRSVQRSVQRSVRPQQQQPQTQQEQTQEDCFIVSVRDPSPVCISLL